MDSLIGIRREDMNRWERRTPLTPDLVLYLVESGDIEVRIQPSRIRFYSDEEYVEAGAEVNEDLSPCPVVFAVKELPIDFIQEERTYIFFSHTIKGQSHNMPMLRRLLDGGCTVIDYECITDERGQRLVFFGRHAGLAGMIDTLWALGERLKWEGLESPFSRIGQAWRYNDLAEAESAVAEAGERISNGGLPGGIVPLIVGFSGYGNVSGGAQEILEHLPTTTVAPEELAGLVEGGDWSPEMLYKVIFEERHMVQPKDPDGNFDLEDYYHHPERYLSKFETYLPHLTVLMNCIYWDERYPRLVTKEYLRRTYAQGKPKLKVIGDLSCDIEGAVEATVRVTDSGNPVYVYHPATGETQDGVEGEGPVILAVDNLPCELPREASEHFSAELEPFVPAIAHADYTVPFDALELAPQMKRAVIVYRGKLTPDYEYIYRFLEKFERGGS